MPKIKYSPILTAEVSGNFVTVFGSGFDPEAPTLMDTSHGGKEVIVNDTGQFTWIYEHKGGAGTVCPTAWVQLRKNWIQVAQVCVTIN